MSINNVSSFWGKDYAAEYKEKAEKTLAESRQYLQKVSNQATVPIGKENDTKSDMKGLVIEHEDVTADKVDKKLTTKAEVKKAEQKAKNEFMEYGTSSGYKVTSEKEAKKMAERYVENEQSKEDVQSTQVFMDKDAYKAAEKKRKAQRKELVEQYREQGLSRKEAKRKADSQLVENEYVRGRKTRAFVEDNKALFYDEDGTFSSDKFKEQAVKYANANTKEGETTNYHLSLKERRKVAEQEGVSANVIKNIAKKSNMSYERDNTNLYKGLTIAAGTAAGIAAAPLFTSSAAAAAAAAGAGSAAVGGSASGGASASAAAAAAASAKTSGVAIGAAAGFSLGVGASAFVKDKGRKEVPVYEPGKPQLPPRRPTPPEPDVPPGKPPQDTTTPVPPVTPEPCPEQKWESEYCDYKVQKGDYWASVVQGKMTYGDGKKPQGNMLRALVHAEKLKHGITNFKLNTMPHVGQTMRLYTDFSDLLENEEYMKKYPELKYLKDVEIRIDCDGKVARGKSSGRPKVRYTRYNGNPMETNRYKQDCHDNVPVRIK